MLSILTLQDQAVCPVQTGTPPSIVDAESAPTAASLLPQIQLLTPRGAAWSTDENYTPDTILEGVWTAISGFAAQVWSDAFTAFSQVFPSAIGFSLEDWETELQLPEPGDPTDIGAMTTADRVMAVQQKYTDPGGCSPGYFICIAAQIGYAVNILELGFFEFDGVTEFDGLTGLELGIDPGQYWIVQVMGVTPEYFTFGPSLFDGVSGLTSFPIAVALERRIRRRANVDTTVIFDYSGL